MEKFFVEFGIEMFYINKEIKLFYWRNVSEGNFIGVGFGEKNMLFEIYDVKRRVVFNVDCIGFLLKFFFEYFIGDLCVLNEYG